MSACGTMTRSGILLPGDGILLKRQIDWLMMPTVSCTTWHDDSLQTVGAKMKTLLHLIHLVVQLIRPSPVRLDLHRPFVRRGFFAVLPPVPVTMRRPQRSKPSRDIG
jgi:hypothetical protein